MAASLGYQRRIIRTFRSNTESLLAGLARHTDLCPGDGSYVGAGDYDVAFALSKSDSTAFEGITLSCSDRARTL